MGCRILVLRDGRAVFYDSVTDTAFGVLMDSEYEALEFQNFVKDDLRSLTHSRFMKLLEYFRERRNNENN